jgi:hypothetical protein
MDELLANRARRRMLAAVAFVVFAIVFGLTSIARAEDSQDIRGTRHGCTDLTTTGAWDELTSASLEDMRGSSALAASLYWTELFIKGGSAVVYVCEAAAADCGSNTTNKLSVASGASITLPLRGLSLRTVSIQATASTTVQVCGFFRTAP